MNHTQASPPPGQPHDPVEAVLAIQRTRQRFVPGALLTVVAALLVVPTWMFTFASANPTYKLRIIAAGVLAALVGLPLRLVGRVVELRLAIFAGLLVGPALWLADFLTLALTGAPGTVVPNDNWFAALTTYLCSAFMATYVAKGDLDISLSGPGASVAVPAPQVWEDPNAAVLTEPANLFRGVLAVPGTLSLTSRQLRYLERGKSKTELLVDLRDIATAAQGLHDRALVVELHDGTSYRFIVFHRDQWVVHINARLTSARRIPA